MVLDVAAHRPYERGLRVSVDRLGSATQAGAVARLLGLEWLVEKPHILTVGALRRAGWTAEDAGARNRENEGAVECTVAIDDGLPAAVFHLPVHLPLHLLGLLTWIHRFFF